MPKVQRMHALALGAHLLVRAQPKRHFQPAFAPVARRAEQLQIARRVCPALVKRYNVIYLVQMVNNFVAPPAAPPRLRRYPPLQVTVDAALVAIHCTVGQSCV